MYNSSDKDKDSVVTLFFDCSVVRMWENGSEGHLFKSHNWQTGPSARPLTFSCIKQDVYMSLWIGDTLDFCQNVSVVCDNFLIKLCSHSSESGLPSVSPHQFT